MPDQVIDTDRAHVLQAEACRTRPMVGWVVMQEPPDYRRQFVARLVIDGPTAYVLLADTLVELRAKLPPNLMRSQRQPADPPGVVEFWFST